MPSLLHNFTTQFGVKRVVHIFIKKIKDERLQIHDKYLFIYINDIIIGKLCPPYIQAHPAHSKYVVGFIKLFSKFLEDVRNLFPMKLLQRMGIWWTRIATTQWPLSSTCLSRHNFRILDHYTKHNI